GVFRDEKHGELEAGVFRVETGDEFGFGFGKIEGSAIRLRDGRGEEADKPNYLRERCGDDVPSGEQSPKDASALAFDNALKAEGVHHEQNANDGHGEGEFVANHLRGAAQAAEQGILGIGSPASKGDAVYAESGDGEKNQKADVWIGNPEIDFLAEEFERLR